jgi:hypothetical protein
MAATLCRPIVAKHGMGSKAQESRLQGFSKVDELGHFDESARRNLSGCTPVTGERFLPLVEMTTVWTLGRRRKRDF